MLIAILALAGLFGAVCLCFFAGFFATNAWVLWLILSWLGIFLVLAGLYFLLLWGACALVDLNKPQVHDSKFYRTLAQLTCSAALPIVLTRVKTTGMEKVPGEGRFLLVCNHLSDLDPVVLLHHFRRHTLSFISKRENSSMFLVGKLMHKMRCPLVNRENDREALKTILRAIQLLKEDTCSMAVFPEGYIHEDRLLHPFRSGVFKIAQKANVPIVVCALRNTQYTFGNAKRLRPTTVYLDLLEVIPAGECQGVTAVELSHRVYSRMAEHLGPDLVKQIPETT